MADDASTDIEGVEADAPDVAAPTPCEFCHGTEDAAIVMEWAKVGVPDNNVLYTNELCYCCAASLLLQMPHSAALDDHPLAMRKITTHVSRPAALEHSEPESFRPLKVRRRSEQIADTLCDLCRKCQVCISLDMNRVSDSAGLDNVRTHGEFCYRCASKYLVEICAGVFRLSESPTAILNII